MKIRSIVTAGLGAILLGLSALPAHAQAAPVVDGCAMKVPQAEVYMFVGNRDGSAAAEAEIGDICYQSIQQFGMMPISKFASPPPFAARACRIFLTNDVTIAIWTAPANASLNLAISMCSAADNGDGNVEWWPSA